MKSDPIKATIVKDNLTLHGDGVLHLAVTGNYKECLMSALKSRGLTLNSPIELTVDNVNTNKTVKQNNTFHDLIMIYYKSGLPSDNSYSDLKMRIKDTFGVRHETRMIAGELWKVLKSWSKYTLKEGRQAIDGLIGEMLHLGCNDKRFQEMIIEWNNFNK